ncbi:MAG: DUF3179 domain-containing protein [Acidobacteria bacterium]|jgi:hypothetical protein|nr:DUF3179 domain-containing protein [Acidobacteriota bacterium]
MARSLTARALSLSIVLVSGVSTHGPFTPHVPPQAPPRVPPVGVFLDAGGSDEAAATRALAIITPAWKDGYAAMFIDMARLLPPRRRGDQLLVHPVRTRLLTFLGQRTGQRFGDDLAAWRDWLWNRPYDPHPDYAAFKAAVYSSVDPTMREFFTAAKSVIRLDEVDWGGVPVNGIPPLDQPRSIPAADASYLRDSHIVFGVVVAGRARAYPKRILAWHEMALDQLGGEDLTVVYCTLCGTVIPYKSVVGGTKRQFGTSGLLYRANKLMFDRETMSLWSTLDGRPVVGALAGQPLTLEAFPVVTTTWGEWKEQHPQTTVLSIETGYDRDYGEGVAYREYFDSDRLMFRVPRPDTRLKNKAEVLGVLVPAVGGGRQAAAFSADFLARTRVHHETLEGRTFVVLTSPKGANRVHDVGAVTIRRWVSDTIVADAAGRRWVVTEDALMPEASRSASALPRVPAFRAFWFGWHAQFPETLLVK